MFAACTSCTTGEFIKADLCHFSRSRHFQRNLVIECNLHCSVASAATAPPSASLRRLHHMLAPRDAATPHMGSEPNSPSGAHMGAAGRLWHCDWTTALPLAVALERRPPSMISVASSCLTCDSPWGFELLVVWPCRDAPSMLLLKTSNARVGVQHAQAPGNSQASKGCAVP